MSRGSRGSRRVLTWFSETRKDSPRSLSVGRDERKERLPSRAGATSRLSPRHEKPHKTEVRTRPEVSRAHGGPLKDGRSSLVDTLKGG